MKDKQNPQSEAKRALGLNAVMAVAMLFLAVVLVRSAFIQLGGRRMFSGCVSAVGAVLFFAVGVIMVSDLVKRLRNKQTTQEEATHGP